MIYNGTTISFQAKGKFHTAHLSHPAFTRILELAKEGRFDDAAELIDVKEAIKQTLEGSKAELKGDQVYYNGEQVHGNLARRITAMVKEGFSVQPLLLFLDNLMENPSKRAVDELYGFLESARLPITDDGHFLAYKSVRQDFKDHHSGTMDNSVGQVVQMERNRVDEDKDRTCSYGLHFAAHQYAEGFGRGGRMVVLKINPKDVVAIPSDYNNQKGRCCRYEVIEEVSRSDKKLVGQAIVGKPKSTSVTFGQPVLDLNSLKVGAIYEFSGDLGGFSPSLQAKGSFTGVYKGKGTIELTEVVMFARTQTMLTTKTRTGLIAKEVKVKPKYVPQVDNYNDSTIWGAVTRRYILVTPEQFPVNRDVAYDLKRESTGKKYRQAFFTRYDEKNGNLVFKYMLAGETAYCTVSDLKDWSIYLSR